MATAQLYTPDDLQALLEADFAARQIEAVVEVGQWDPQASPGEPRVIIGYGDGEMGEPGGHYQPGAMWAPPGTTGEVARAVLDDAQRLTLLIHAPAVGSAEGAARGARRATDGLLRATMAAIRRALGGPFREQAKVRWPKKDDDRFVDYPGFTYGSVAEVEIVLPSPVLDDAYQTINVTQAGATVQFDYPDGSSTNPEDA